MNRLEWPFLHGTSRGIEVTQAQDEYLHTADGKKILDAAGGAIVANIGHGRTRVIDAMTAASRATSYVVPTWLTPSRRALLDQLQADWLPESLTRVHITSGGTEAVEAALKIALHYQQAIGESQRTQIIGRDISYHGTTLAAASISGHPARKRGLEGALPAFLETPTPYPLRCPLGAHHTDAGHYYIEQLTDLIEQTGAESIAALLAEPITGSSGGAIVPPDDYWPAVRDVCDRYGIVLILDEVMTGFGRTGKPFGYQHWPITPDILVSGKGLGGGYAPLGGVYATETVGAAIEEAGFMVMFNTFGAHPAACAAAAEVLQILKEENLVQQADERGLYLQQQLHAAFDDHPHVAEVRGRGLLAAIEVVRDVETLERFPLEANISSRIVGKSLQNEVFFYLGGTSEVRDIVCMGPPFTISEAQIDHMVSVLADSVSIVTSNQ